MRGDSKGPGPVHGIYSPPNRGAGLFKTAPLAPHLLLIPSAARCALNSGSSVGRPRFEAWRASRAAGLGAFRPLAAEQGEHELAAPPALEPDVLDEVGLLAE